jgi:hypothetical protein
MPKRTNDFQRLVYLVRVNLAAGATVTESKMLADLVTKHKREVDVCIEGHVGGDPVIVCVECRDSKRVTDVTWVNAMKGKHERLPTSLLILASRRGFTAKAREVATSYGIKTFSLEEVDQVDFPALLKSSSSLWTKSVTVSASKVLVRVRATTSLAEEAVRVTPTNLVYSSDGKELGQIGELVEMMLNSGLARDHLLREGMEDHAWFQLVWDRPRDTTLGNPLFMKQIDPDGFREIESIQITGPCKFEITQFGLRRGKLGDVHLAWGKTEILGRDTVVVATKDAAGVEKLSINIAGKPE